MCRGTALPDRLAFQTQHSRPFGQRQHSRRLQGGGGADDHHEPAAEPVRRSRWRPQLLRPGDPACRSARRQSICSCWQLESLRSCFCSSANGFCRAGRSDSPWWRCRSSWRSYSDLRPWEYRSPEKFRRDCRLSRCLRSGCWNLKNYFRSRPDVCCWPISKVFRQPAALRPSMDTASMCDRSFWGWGPRTSRRRSDMAIPLPAACRNPPSMTRRAHARRWHWFSARLPLHCACFSSRDC